NCTLINLPKHITIRKVHANLPPRRACLTTLTSRVAHTLSMDSTTRQFKVSPMQSPCGIGQLMAIGSCCLTCQEMRHITPGCWLMPTLAYGSRHGKTFPK